MTRQPQTAEPLADYERYSNRARFLEETSHGILELLRRSGKNRAWLARRLGCSPAMITKVLEGSHNFRMETLADITLALDRAVHVTWGADLTEMRIPRDEALVERKTVPIKQASMPIKTTAPHQESPYASHWKAEFEIDIGEARDTETTWWFGRQFYPATGANDTHPA